MSAIKLSTPSSGSISLSPADTASNLTITVPAVTGTMITTASTFAGTGPAFGAYRTSDQSISSGTFTKVACNNEEFDTASCFDTSNNRFTPNVAGYYYFGGTVVLNSGSPTRVILSIYKNGSETKRLLDSLCASTAAGSTGSCILYMNGSTDYVELYTYWNAAVSITGNQVECNFYGSLLRAA